MNGRGVLIVQSVFAKDGVNADIHLFALLRKQVWPTDLVLNKVLNISPKTLSFPPENARRQGRRTKTKRPIIIDYQSFALYPLRGLRGTNLINWIVVIYLYTYFFGYVFSYENRERTYLFVLSGRWPFNGNFYRYKDNKSYWKKLIFW